MSKESDSCLNKPKNHEKKEKKSKSDKNEGNCNK